jgi:GNAT superfamily N-acetyltransferase
VTPYALRLIRECFPGSLYPLPDESVETSVDGLVVCHVGIFWRTLELVEHGPYEVTGIGLVCTHPSWRRLGLATTLLEVARRRGALHSRPLLALFAGQSESALYRVLGYGDTNVPTLLTLPLLDTPVTDRGERW